MGRNRAFSILSQDARIVTSALGDQLLLAGAAALVLAGLFRGPVDLTPPEA